MRQLLDEGLTGLQDLVPSALASTRSLALPVAVEADSDHTAVLNGVLTLTLPKTEKVRPQTIRVTPA